MCLRDYEYSLSFVIKDDVDQTMEHAFFSMKEKKLYIDKLLIAHYIGQ